MTTTSMATTVVCVRGADPHLWLSDPDHVFVGGQSDGGWRPSPWANPFYVGMNAREAELMLWLMGLPTQAERQRGDSPLGAEEVVRWYVRWLFAQPRLANNLATLKGKTLGYLDDADANAAQVLARLADEEDS